LYLDGKKCAIPSLHRDSFAAKVPGSCPDAAAGNATSLYCRAVMFKPIKTTRRENAGSQRAKHNSIKIKIDINVSL